MEELLLKMLEKVLADSPNYIIICFLVWGLFVRPLLKKISAISLYVKRFLALQQRRARGQEALVKALEALAARDVPK